MENNYNQNHVRAKTLNLEYDLYTIKDIDSHVMRAAEKGKEWETFLCEKIKTLNLKEGSVCLDIGAYIGSHTIPMAKLGAEVYCWEPISVPFNLLKHNILINNLEDRIYYYNCGLGDICESKTCRTSYTGTSSLNRNLSEYKYAEVINIHKLDQHLFDSVDFIKIDVEGYEWKVLEGGHKTIEKHRPVIALESFNTTKNKSNIKEFCKKYQYHCQKLKSTDYWLTPI